MASTTIHLIAGQKYYENNNITDEHSFLTGCLAPDNTCNKYISHYSDPHDHTSYTEAITHKVNLYSYCRDNNIDSDYNKGYFFHLILDYIFYKIFLLNSPAYKKHEHLGFSFLAKNVYNDYDKLNSWLFRLYPEVKKEFIPDTFLNSVKVGNSKLILKAAILKIINYCAKIDLEKTYYQISNNQPIEQIIQIQF